MPAVTLSPSTSQISQNCGVRHARLRWTCFCVIMPAVAACAVQPFGVQPAGATRKPNAPSVIATR